VLEDRNSCGRCPTLLGDADGPGQVTAIIIIHTKRNGKILQRRREGIKASNANPQIALNDDALEVKHDVVKILMPGIAGMRIRPQTTLSQDRLHGNWISSCPVK